MPLPRATVLPWCLRKMIPESDGIQPMLQTSGRRPVQRFSILEKLKSWTRKMPSFGKRKNKNISLHELKTSIHCPTIIPRIETHIKNTLTSLGGPASDTRSPGPSRRENLAGSRLSSSSPGMPNGCTETREQPASEEYIAELVVRVRAAGPHKHQHQQL